MLKFFPFSAQRAADLKMGCQPAGLLEGNLQDGQWQLFIFSLIDLNSPTLQCGVKSTPLH